MGMLHLSISMCFTVSIASSNFNVKLFFRSRFMYHMKFKSNEFKSIFMQFIENSPIWYELEHSFWISWIFFVQRGQPTTENVRTHTSISSKKNLIQSDGSVRVIYGIRDTPKHGWWIKNIVDNGDDNWHKNSLVWLLCLCVPPFSSVIIHTLTQCTSIYFVYGIIIICLSDCRMLCKTNYGK